MSNYSFYRVKQKIGLFLLALQASTLVAQQFRYATHLAHLQLYDDNSGVAVADYDQDGDLDIYLVARKKYSDGNYPLSRLLENEGNGSFVDVTAEMGLISTVDYDIGLPYFLQYGERQSVSWGDINNDGFPDLFLGNSGTNELYLNDSGQGFIDISESSGLGGFCSNCFTVAGLWVDYNLDGYLDLYVTDYNEDVANRLYKNMGNNTFELVDFQDQVQKSSFCAIPIYIGEDKYPDIYVSNDFNDDNALLFNDNGNGFVNNTSTYNLTDPYDGMGMATSDFDNNGEVEIFIANRGENGFYSKTENGTFTNISQLTGIYDTGWAWAAAFADYNLDLFDDVYITTGLNSPEKDFYFENVEVNGERVFEQVATGALNPFTAGGTVISFDYDNDGDQDILATSFDHEPMLFQNRAIDPFYSDEIAGNWLKVNLQGTVSNRDGLGSRVTLTVNEDVSLYKEYNGVSFHSQSLQPLHFGLSNVVSSNMSINIVWPSGIVEDYMAVPINSHIKLVEGLGLFVLDNNLFVPISGCTDPQSCNYNPNATIDDGSCSYLNSLNIEGVQNTYPFYEETYSVMLSNEYEVFWSVTNGEILNGQGTDQITVKWGILGDGVVSVFYDNGICSSEALEIEIGINYYDEGATRGTFSVARLWNEALLEAIRLDKARPTVHARNLFHLSAAMYDAWSVFHEPAHPYFLGKTVHGFETTFEGFNETGVEFEHQAISFAAYRLLTHRFEHSTHQEETQAIFDNLMRILDLDMANLSLDYSSGDAAALGNYIANQIIQFGLQDGSNEVNQYENQYYEPVNNPMSPELMGNPNISNPNRWQPLSFDLFIDQSGNVLDQTTPGFLGAEWGNTMPFALSDLTMNYRDGNPYPVYLDPGSPPVLDGASSIETQQYADAFAMVAVWSAHLSTSDNVFWDISPGSMGNVDLDAIPTELEDYGMFYNYLDGGDSGNGYEMNPITGMPYDEQLVLRGDYTRVLAEFWADGPDSETPPGHWFVLLNGVSDNPLTVKKFRGEGLLLDDLEWDIKSYFVLGATMHDVAISAWGIKGWYDYIRPISAIRYMAGLGQSTDQSLANYNPFGIPLIENHIEVVFEGDPLGGESGEHVGKIKLRAWRGHDFIESTETDNAGVDWILAENWWPYQRPTFVTPNFAGYISGHSTFSRAAAEVLTQLTGTPYFPGGMGEFIAKQNEFLVFEEGPSQDVILQWATYRDASDQCSLSRIWGGIHPYIDDLPGRLIGEQIGVMSFELAETYFTESLSTFDYELSDSKMFPNPVSSNNFVFVTNTDRALSFSLVDLVGRSIPLESTYDSGRRLHQIGIDNISPGIYVLHSEKASWKLIVK